MEQQNNWERRWHPLLQEWVIIAGKTSDRPWSGETLDTKEEEKPEYDPNCYLCPGVTRASGIQNPNYTKPWAFTNDFASFSFDAPNSNRNEFFEQTAPVYGTCRVICFHPKHNLTMAELSKEEIEDVFDIWNDEYTQLGSYEQVQNVLIFENKGQVVGTSNPHPHGQIYATGFIPKIVAQQRKSFTDYYNTHHTHLLRDLLEHEQLKKERIICQNDHFVALIPFFARFVFETYIIPKRHVARISDLKGEEFKALAEIHKDIITKFDNLYNMSFPNITMLQNAPTDGTQKSNLFHFHIEFYPPLRDPDKLKYLAGFESGGGNIINPEAPESAAAKMREASTVHYKQRNQ